MSEDYYEDYSEAECKRILELTDITDLFCDKYLNAEYKELCQEMAEELVEDGAPIMRGRPDSWAAAIAAVIGYVNCIDDKSQTLHMKFKDMAELFNVSLRTMQNKALSIRKDLGIDRLDPKWYMLSNLAANPRVWMLEIDGFIQDIRSCPREIQEAAYSQGLIPWIPADHPEMHQTVQKNKAASPSPEKPEKKYHEIEGPTLFDKEIE